MNTGEYDGTPDHVLLETITLKDLGEGTLMTDLLIYQSVEDRNEMLHAGMKTRYTESMDRLKDLLAKVLKEGNL